MYKRQPVPEVLKGKYQSYTQADAAKLLAAGYDGGFTAIDPVSYTHLDVYKRQDVNSGSYSGKSNLEETVMEINREAAREIAYQLRPVSYKHLDVYKRQVMAVVLLNTPLTGTAEAAKVAVVPIQVNEQAVERAGDFNSY